MSCERPTTAPMPPAMRRNPTLRDQLACLSIESKTVLQFARATGIADENAKTYLDALIIRGYVERGWFESSGVYSLTVDGLRKLREGIAHPEYAD